PYPNWNSLPNGITYHQLPVISGLGNEVFYPAIKTGWDSTWGPEYTSLPEFENALIDYGGEKTVSKSEIIEEISLPSVDITFWLYGKRRTAGAPEPAVDLYFNSTWQGYKTLSMPSIDVFEWSNVSWNNLVGDIEDLNNIMTRLKGTSDSGEIWVDVVYCEVDYGLGSAIIRPMSDGSLIEWWGFSSPTNSDAVDERILEPAPGSMDEYIRALIGGVGIDEYIYEPINFYPNSISNTNYIYTDGTNFDSGELSQYLNGQDRNFGDQSINNFHNNYIEEVLISNPYISENFNLSQMYNPEIHDELNQNGLYNYYDGAQRILSKAKLVDIQPIDNNLMIQDSGILPSTSGQGGIVDDFERALSNWSEYIYTYQDEDDFGNFGMDLTFEFPTAGYYDLSSIQLAFDATIVSESFAEEYPLTIQLFTTDTNSNSLALAPVEKISDKYYYINNELDYDFWRWNETSFPTDEFRPKWGTTDLNHINSISYGNVFPNWVNGAGEIIVPESIRQGATFLDNNPSPSRSFNDSSHDLKFLSYNESTGDANKFQLENIPIYKHHYDINDDYPDYAPYGVANLWFIKTSSLILVNNQLKLRIMTNKEVTQDNVEAYLAIGDFTVYYDLKSAYLNYDEFDAYHGSHNNKDLYLAEDGMTLLREGQFNVRPIDPTPLKFYDNLQFTEWELIGSQEEFITWSEPVISSVTIDSSNPNKNYEGDP
ncbi:MAG: hypothetical protein ACW99A_23830, partial [Candidatus Kariarchaeaceae archaeon]